MPFDLIVFNIYRVMAYIPMLIAIPGFVGAAQIAMTRDDAFTAGDRHPKWVWFALVVGACLGLISTVMILQVVGAVIIGIYFFDVRPQIKDLLSGSYGY